MGPPSTPGLVALRGARAEIVQLHGQTDLLVQLIVHEGVHALKELVDDDEEDRLVQRLFGNMGLGGEQVREE